MGRRQHLQAKDHAVILALLQLTPRTDWTCHVAWTFVLASEQRIVHLPWQPAPLLQALERRGRAPAGQSLTEALCVREARPCQEDRARDKKQRDVGQAAV